MSERLNRCPKCHDIDLHIQLLNPDTHGMNCDATFTCSTCNHVWDGKTTSPYMKGQIRKGLKSRSNA